MTAAETRAAANAREAEARDANARDAETRDAEPVETDPEAGSQAEAGDDTTERNDATEAANRRPEVDNDRAHAVDRLVNEGVPRLSRGNVDMLATGVVAGFEVGLGVLALLFVEMTTGSMLLGGLAFSFGFVALLLGRSELFTEGFLVPVTVVAAGEARVRDLLRFWLGSAVGNLLGGWVIMWIAMEAYPELHHQAVESATRFIDAGISVRGFALAVLAGGVITVMTRMHNGTDSTPTKVLVSVFSAFILSGLGLAHSILESLLIFSALDTSFAPFGWLDWLGWFGWTVLGNVVGGFVLVTLLRLVRSRDLIMAHRDNADPSRSVQRGRRRS